MERGVASPMTITTAEHPIVGLIRHRTNRLPSSMPWRSQRW